MTNKLIFRNFFSIHRNIRNNTLQVRNIKSKMFSVIQKFRKLRNYIATKIKIFPKKRYISQGLKVANTRNIFKNISAF